MATIREALEMAVGHHQAGRFQQAEAIYEQILIANPQQADALHLLGVMSIQLGQFAVAADLIRRAVAVQPQTATFHSNLGVAQRNLGQLDESAASFRQAILLDPNMVDAHSGLGDLLASCGRREDAIAHYRRAVELNPQRADVLNNLGNLLQDSKQFAEAVRCYERTLVLQPNAAEVYNNLGNALAGDGKLPEAVAAYQRSLQLKPDYPEAHYNLANACKQQGVLALAIQHFREAIRLHPGFTEAHINLGAALAERSEHREAEACYRTAITLNPRIVEAHNNLGTALKEQGQLDAAEAAYREALRLQSDYLPALNNLGTIAKAHGDSLGAERCYRQALQLDPGFAEALVNLGGVLKDHGDLDEAERCCRQAIAIQPNSAVAYDNLGNTLMYLGQVDEALAAYERALAINPKSAGAHSNYLFAKQYQPGATIESLAEAHSRWNDLFAAPLRSTWRPHTNSRDPDRVLRVGFVSPDLSHHPIGYLLVRVLEQLDRTQLATYCYSTRPQVDDQSTRIARACNAWRDVATFTDESLAELIRSDEIDILFDLSGHTAGNRLAMFARKPAPVQVSWMGYVGPTGVEAIEYLIADRSLVSDELVGRYREQVIRLPVTSCCYETPVAAPAVGPLPAIDRGYVTFASFNNPAKINSAVIDTWATILQRVPTARMLMKFRGMDSQKLNERYRKQFAEHGVRGDRIEFQGVSPFAAMLEQYNTVDIALDPFPYNGGTTTMLALLMGVPVVTIAGETIAARQSCACLSAIGVQETTAGSLTEYVEIAVALANDLPRLGELRRSLRPRFGQSPLGDAARLADDLTMELRRVWRQWCAREE